MPEEYKLKHFKKNNCSNCPKKIDCIEKDLLCDSIKRIIVSEMVEECTGFYRVFEHLKPITFLKSDIQEIGKEQYQKNGQLFCPCVVCGIFAAELALKILIFKENTIFLKGHDIQKLYANLPNVHKQIILDRLETGKRLDNLSVDDEIDKLKNHFVKWRYGYESLNGLQADIFIETLVETICNYVLNELG